MKCSNCGNEVLSDHKFCIKCGAPVSSINNNVQSLDKVTANTSINENIPLQNNTIDSSVNSVSSEKKKNKNTTIGIIIFVIVVVVGLIFGIGAFLIGKIVDTSVEIIADAGNTIDDIANNIYENIEDTYEEEQETKLKEGYNTKLDWATPILKSTEKPTYLKGELNIQNVEDYDVYMSIIKISTENIFVNGFKFTTTDEEVKIITNDCEDIKEDKVYTCYRYIYIIAPKGKDIFDVGITVYDDKEKITIYIKDNNVQPVKEGKATFGDCITCTIDENRCYMVLLELVGEDVLNVNELSSPVFGEVNELSASLMVAYIIEKMPKNNANTRDIFLTFSNDAKIDADNVGDKGANLTEGIYVQDIAFTQFGLMSDSHIFLNYIYKKDSKTLNEAKKIWENDEIGIKFLNKVEIDCMN